MDRYLVESPHELRECARTLQQFLAMGYLHNFAWGCRAGVHSGWAMIEAENEARARMAVPPAVRAHARVIRLNPFSPEEVEALHG